jgi:hypothetical protein
MTSQSRLAHRVHHRHFNQSWGFFSLAAPTEPIADARFTQSKVYVVALFAVLNTRLHLRQDGQVGGLQRSRVSQLSTYKYLHTRE